MPRSAPAVLLVAACVAGAAAGGLMLATSRCASAAACDRLAEELGDGQVVVFARSAQPALAVGAAGAMVPREQLPVAVECLWWASVRGFSCETVATAGGDPPAAAVGLAQMSIGCPEADAGAEGADAAGIEDCVLEVDVELVDREAVFLPAAGALLFHVNASTTTQRAKRGPQLRCVGEDAPGGACAAQWMPRTVVACYNLGPSRTSGRPRWLCESDAPAAARIETPSVSCEGFAHDEDAIVRRSSCALTFRMGYPGRVYYPPASLWDRAVAQPLAVKLAAAFASLGVAAVIAGSIMGKT